MTILGEHTVHELNDLVTALSYEVSQTMKANIACVSWRNGTRPRTSVSPATPEDHRHRSSHPEVSGESGDTSRDELNRKPAVHVWRPRFPLVSRHHGSSRCHGSCAVLL